MAKNPKFMESVKNKPDFSVRAHATLRFHGKRIEIGVRIPPDMVKRITSKLLLGKAVEDRVEKLIRLMTTRNYGNRTPERMRAYAADLGLLRRP